MAIRDPNTMRAPREPELPPATDFGGGDAEDQGPVEPAELEKRRAARKPKEKPVPAPADPKPVEDPSAETPTKRKVESIAIPTIDANAFYSRRMAARARE